MALPIIGIVAAIVGWCAKALSAEVLKFVATRALLYGLFTFVLPVILYNVFAEIVTEVMTYSMNHLNSSGYTGYMAEITGLGAWIASNIQLPAAMSIFLSAVGLRFVLSIFKR